MEAKKLTLVNGESKYTIKIGTPSFKRRVAYRDVSRKYLNQMGEIQDRYPSLKGIDRDTVLTGELAIQQTLMSNDSEEHTDRYLVEYVKVIVDKDSIPEEIAELFNGTIDNEFWQNQNAVDLSEAIDSFRERVK